MRTRTKLLLGGAAVAGAAIAATRGRKLVEELHALDHAGHSNDLDGDELVLAGLDGASLFVTQSGPADGPVVVLPHCWTGSRHVWSPVARRLVAAGCRVVRWDQRGHGASVAGDLGHTVEALGGDLAVVLTELDLRDVVLGGHSMGGMTIESAAAHHPDVFAERVRGIVLVSTAANGLRNPVNKFTPQLVAHRHVGRAFASPRVGKRLVRATFGKTAHPHHLEATRADFAATPPGVRADFARTMSEMDLRDGIASIAVPTTILVGSRDTLTPVPLSRAMAAAIPDAELRVLPGFGHMLPFEAPDVVADALLERVRA